MAWYDRGVCFSCKGCGHCCSGEPGFVFLSSEEIDSIASFLDMERDDFLTAFTRRIDRGEYYEVSLRERADYSCIFLKNNRCEIYPVRPLQCRTYPFWDYLMKDRVLYEAEKEACPGIGEGELHSASEIREKLKQGAEYRRFRLPVENKT